MHDKDITPTPHTLAQYVVYMCTTNKPIQPASVKHYLSGICKNLEHIFPNVRSACRSDLVRGALKGCHRLYARPSARKDPLPIEALSSATAALMARGGHDTLLCTSMLLTGFFGLLRLGELTFPDNSALRNWRKVARRSSVDLKNTSYAFTLPTHKADPLFEGNRVLVLSRGDDTDPLLVFRAYLRSRDARYPYSIPLWLAEDGSVPTRSFFLRWLRGVVGSDVSKLSMRAGGATALAQSGADLATIQAIGRWSSLAFKIYIRKHPALLQHSRSSRAGNGCQLTDVGDRQ